MAVFLINICKFNGCGIKFDSLGELITHIENIHIDYDPLVVEQKEQSQPSCLPLSYVLRFITDAARKDGPFINNTNGSTDLKRKLAIKHHSYSMSSSNRSNTPTGSEIDDEEMMVSESENSNDSWTTEEFSSEFIMRYGSRHSGTAGNSASNEKPFACPVPGCKKRYKNVNGIKYHSKNGHKKEGKVRKGFKCYCGKSYKTSQGLKNHSMLVHNNASNEALNSSVASTGSHSPSSASNGATCNSLTNNQSQLSPNNSNSNSNNSVSNNNNNSSSNNNNTTIGIPSTATATAISSSPSSIAQTKTNSTTSTAAISTANVPPSFNLITLKTTPMTNIINSLSASSAANSVATSHAISSTRNPNKLVKVNSECFDNAVINGKASGKNLIIASAAATNNGNIIAAMPNPTCVDDTNANGKINLPSLVNFGILTPATSPKQQATSQISPNQMSTTTTSSANSNSSNESTATTLPLTPISPNMNKTLKFNNNNNNISNNNNNNSTTTNNNSKTNCTNSQTLSNGLIGSAIITDGSMTEDT